jgi:hypothetical protein
LRDERGLHTLTVYTFGTPFIYVMMLLYFGNLTSYFFCKHVHDDECPTVPKSFFNQWSRVVTVYVMSLDTVDHITHSQQPTIVCELTVEYSRSDTRQTVGLRSKRRGNFWITRCLRGFGQDPNPNPKVVTPTCLERNWWIAPQLPVCMQSLNFDWTEQPVRGNKVGSKVSAAVPTLVRQCSLSRRFGCAISSTAMTLRVRRGKGWQVTQC